MVSQYRNRSPFKPGQSPWQQPQHMHKEPHQAKLRSLADADLFTRQFSLGNFAQVSSLLVPKLFSAPKQKESGHKPPSLQFPRTVFYRLLCLRSHKMLRYGPHKRTSFLRRRYASLQNRVKGNRIAVHRTGVILVLRKNCTIQINTGKQTFAA